MLSPPPSLTLLLLLLLLLHPLASALALPNSIDPPTPFPPLKSPHCQNAPALLAGTLFTPRSLPPRSRRLPPRQRGQSIVYCAPHTRTYINLLMGSYAYGQAVHDMLQLALTTLDARIAESGDVALPNGRFVGSAALGPGLNLVLNAVNAGNHQTTRGVLRAALGAVMEYMQQWGFGEVYLQIWDGDNMVGKAAVVTKVVG